MWACDIGKEGRKKKSLQVGIIGRRGEGVSNGFDDKIPLVRVNVITFYSIY